MKKRDLFYNVVMVLVFVVPLTILVFLALTILVSLALNEHQHEKEICNANGMETVHLSTHSPLNLCVDKKGQLFLPKALRNRLQSQPEDGQTQ